MRHKPRPLARRDSKALPCPGATPGYAEKPRRLPRGVALLSVLVLLLAFAPSASASIRFVAKRGGDGSGDGRSEARAARSPTLSLVSARDHIDGGFAKPNTIWADKDRVYLASYTGKLFVLARNQAADFPVIQAIQESTAPLTAVVGDRQRLYVASNDAAGNGVIRVYHKTNPLVLERTVPLGFGANSLVIVDSTHLYASSAEAAGVNRQRIFVNRLNPSAQSVVLDRETLAPVMSFAAPFTPGITEVYDRTSGEYVAGVPDPLEFCCRNNPPDVYVDDKVLALTAQGRGISVYDPRTLKRTYFAPTDWPNTVTRRGQWLIEGNESGAVHLYDLRTEPRIAQTVDLPLLTGHTRIEDIEIRALWTDHFDNLVFAGSSWGNDLTRGPDLPSFFVLKLR
jgi:hypothetical protein